MVQLTDTLYTDDIHACRPCAGEVLLVEAPHAAVLALALLCWVKAKYTK